MDICFISEAVTESCISAARVELNDSFIFTPL